MSHIPRQWEVKSQKEDIGPTDNINQHHILWFPLFQWFVSLHCRSNGGFALLLWRPTLVQRLHYLKMPWASPVALACAAPLFNCELEPLCRILATISAGYHRLSMSASLDWVPYLCLVMGIMYNLKIPEARGLIEGMECTSDGPQGAEELGCRLLLTEWLQTRNDKDGIQIRQNQMRPTLNC